MSSSECSLCNELINNDLFKSKCDHNFHKECLKEWTDNFNYCPICRTENIYAEKQTSREVNFNINHDQYREDVNIIHYLYGLRRPVENNYLNGIIGATGNIYADGPIGATGNIYPD